MRLNVETRERKKLLESWCFVRNSFSSALVLVLRGRISSSSEIFMEINVGRGAWSMFIKDEGTKSVIRTKDR